jgi:hypothetical protein
MEDVMSGLLTIITEDDLRDYAQNTVSDDLRQEIETLVANDEKARDTLRRAHRQVAATNIEATPTRTRSSTTSSRPKVEQGAETMKKATHTQEQPPELSARDARQAVKSGTSKRVLVGGLALVAILATAALVIGFSGIGADLNASLPGAIIPDNAPGTGGAS